MGVEAGHKGEELAECGLSYGKSKVQAGIRQRRMKPWRDVSRAERASVRANADFLYQKALHDDPALAASNPVSRYLQKKRIQRNYAKQVRQAGKTAKDTAAATQSAARRAKEAAKKSVVFIRRHSRVVLLVVGIGACVGLLFGGMSSCSMMGGSGVGGGFLSSYLSEDADMLAAEAGEESGEGRSGYRPGRFCRRAAPFLPPAVCRGRMGGPGFAEIYPAFRPGGGPAGRGEGGHPEKEGLKNRACL